MKIVFFLLLLSNIVFFLFEFTSLKKQPVQIVDDQTKQILLLSELPEEHKAIEQELVAPGKVVAIDLIDNKASRVKNITLSAQELDRSIPDIENEFKVEKAEKDHDLEIDKPILTESIKATEKAESLKEEMTLSSDKVLPAEKESYCYQLGPFKDQVMLTDWITKNNIDLSQVTEYKKQKKSETGFLVYYPRAESYEKSKQNIQFLKNKGITDFWLFRRGELKGHISLGLFVKESRAKDLKNSFVKKGINVEIMTRYKEQPEWYADIFSENKISSDRLESTGSTCPVKNDEKQAKVTSL